MKTKISLCSVVCMLMLSVFLFTGCEELLNPPKKVTSVTITQNDQTLTVGNTLQLTTTIAPSDATDKDVTWSSSDASVATVSATGLVSAVAAGSATITVTTEDQSKTDTVVINVTPPPVAVTGVTIDQDDQILSVNNTLQLTATIAPSNATTTNVTWSSNNTSVATVSTTGLVYAVAAGSATITVTTVDQSKTDTIVITVKNNYVVMTLTNKTDASDIKSFLLGSGPAQGSTFDSMATFTSYDVPTHLIYDMGAGNGSMMVATTEPANVGAGNGNFIPYASADYPFDSLYMFALDAEDSSCIGTAIDTIQFGISSKTDANNETFRAAPSSNSQVVTITFSEFGTEYVAGTFSGEITDDNSVAYDVTGSFRILRATAISNP